LKRMLVATQSEATPSSEEGQRILSFFINRWLISWHWLVTDL
jgi:hypothetical protein